MATYGTFVDGVTLKASEANDFFKKATVSTGITQGVTPGQNTSTRYFVVNKLVVVVGRASFSTPGGTSGSVVEMTLPVTASSGSFRVIGSARYEDFVNDVVYVLRIVKTSTTKAQFLSEGGTSLTDRFGINPAVTIQTGSFGSTLSYHLIYEAA
jgi:hypothetical protein